MNAAKQNQKPKCAGCFDRPPKWPKEDPHFCTQRCAADWAVAMTESEHWNPELGTWDE